MISLNRNCCCLLLTGIVAIQNVLASTYPVTDASQSSCYNEKGSKVTCKGTGQDGMFKKLPQSYCDRGDQTVQDMVRAVIM